MKKVCAVLLVLSLSLCPFINFSTVKASDTEQLDIQILKVASKRDLHRNYDNLNEVDVVQTEDSTFEQIELEDVKEVLDNGTDFFVNHAELGQMEELFDTSASMEESKETLACYITADNAGYEVLPVYADVIYDEEENVSDQKYESDTKALYEYVTNNMKDEWKSEKGTADSSQISTEEICQYTKQKADDSFLSRLTEEELAALQTSTLIGSSFCEKTKFVYFYKEGSAGGIGTDYVYSGLVTKAGWSKIGSLNLAVYGLKIRTNDDTTFDNIYSTATASGLNDKYVKYFRVNVGVSELSSNAIIDETVSTGNTSSTTGKLATSVSSSGSIVSGGYTTYTYNPSGLNTSTNFKDKYERTWTFSPRTYKSNASYKVRPGITLKKSDGKKSAVTGSVSVDAFQVSGGIRTYTIKDTVKTSIKFKNHAEV